MNSTTSRKIATWLPETLSGATWAKTISPRVIAFSVMLLSVKFNIRGPK
jgi:hypothetical protein